MKYTYTDAQMLEMLREKAIVTIPGMPPPGSVVPFGHKRNKQLLALAYTASVWAYRCSLTLANSGSDMPWGIESNGDLLDEGHPAVFLLDAADDQSNFTDIYRDTVLDKKINGEAFWKMEFFGSQIFRYSRLPARQTDAIYQGGRLSHFEFNNGFEMTNYSIEQIVHFKEFGSLGDEPVTPMQVAIDSISSDQNVDTTVKAFFANYGVPAYAWVSESHIFDGDLERYSAWYQKLMRGVTKRYRAAFMGGGFKPFKLQAPIAELALKDLRKIISVHICAAFGVPPALVGAFETANRSTWEQMQISMHHGQIIPDGRIDAGIINAQLMPHLGDVGKFLFLTNKIEVLQEERNGKSERIMSQFNSGLISQQTALRELNYTMTDAGPGLVAGSGTSPAQNATKIELEKVLRKALRMRDEGRIDQFRFKSDILQPEHVEVVREMVIS